MSKKRYKPQFFVINGKVYSTPLNLTEAEIRYAQSATTTNTEAAKFLGVSYSAYLNAARRYIDFKTGKTLFDLLKNSTTRSKLTTSEQLIKKMHKNKSQIQTKLIEEGKLDECCCICGFNERRINDYKIPLVLQFKDGNDQNYDLENLELVCFNHAFLYYDKTKTR